MDVSKAVAFAADHHNAVLATTRVDGRPQLSPVTVASHPDGVIEISSRETAFKVRNLRRDPRVSLCVLSDAFYGEFVQVEGVASIVTLPEAMDGLVDYYRRVSGEHPDWDDYRAAMERDRRVLIRISVLRAGPDREG